ncbi:MAG: ABC transporter ATP-binding protein [Oscillospiraceae bacterium]|nr:ABC transporter ATP-binding protein [Oscillospiraceae bacterium]
MSVLEVKALSVSIGRAELVKDLSFSVNEGQWLMICGPNGAGKSTLLNAITGGYAYSGTVLYKGESLKKLSPKKRAAELGILAQNHYVGYEFTVEEVVALGRYAHSKNVLGGMSDEDERHINEALSLTGLNELRNHSVLTLSGGELQRTFLAQVIAQNPKLLLLDEPTNHLDLIYQKQVFELIEKWLEVPGRAVISVVHDLSLARAFGTDALLMDKGRLLSSGDVKKVLSPENLNSVYGMDVGKWMRTMLSQWT